MGEGLKVLSHLKGTTDEKIDAIARDVKAETAEMRKIIEGAEFGIPAPSLASMTAVSDEAGINVTVTATDATVDYSNDKAVLATTKGVMVRYKDGSYPTNKEDGELAFIDEDLFTVDTNGSRVAKAKTHLVVGLTKDHVYYFSAFPYTQQGAHNERLGAGNVAKCQWTGTKGTLTVTVTQDHDFVALGEITLTLTPISGGNAVTKTRTGSGTVVFDSLEAGKYTLSCNAQANFVKPNNQTITITAGQPNVATAAYKVDIEPLENASWELISTASKAGVASQLFSIGATKNITINGETLTMEIVGFNHDNLTGGGKAGITFGMKHLMKDPRRMNASNTNSGGWTGSEMYSWLTTTCYNGLPADLRSIIRSVDKKTSAGKTSSTINTDSMKIFLFSEKEVGLSSYSYTGEGETYARFTGNSVRIKKMSNGSGSANWWWLRSPRSDHANYFCGVNNDGSAGGYSASFSGGVCFGFCV